VSCHPEATALREFMIDPSSLSSFRPLHTLKMLFRVPSYWAEYGPALRGLQSWINVLLFQAAFMIINSPSFSTAPGTNETSTLMQRL